MNALTINDFSRSNIESAYENAVKRYIDQRHQKVDEFVNQHYSFKGSLALHKQSIGWDIVKTPVNAVGSLATAVKGVGAFASRAMGANRLYGKLNDHSFFLETRFSKELEWKLRTELVELPFKQDDRAFNHDALMLEILNEPLIYNLLTQTLAAIDSQHHNESFKARLTQSLEEYLGSRAAAADITTSLLAISVGALALQKLTPGMLSLSGGIASGLAHSAAVQSFWAGPYAGSLFYSVFNVSASPLLAAGVFTALIIPVSALATFSGIATDPLQKKLGLHAKRLHKLVDSIEESLIGQQDKGFVAKDHYVARIFDFVDWANLVIKAAVNEAK